MLCSIPTCHEMILECLPEELCGSKNNKKNV